MTAAAPSGVVTFLFTDVEGSSRRWEADADGMRAALAAHDALLRTAIEAHGGFMFKHTGDGVCAAFASPRSAVDAAVAAQRALEFVISVNCSPRRWPRCASRRVLYSSETLTMTR
jgi:class 3 adenylate cyclase